MIQYAYLFLCHHTRWFLFFIQTCWAYTAKTHVPKRCFFIWEPFLPKPKASLFQQSINWIFLNFKKLSWEIVWNSLLAVKPDRLRFPKPAYARVILGVSEHLSLYDYLIDFLLQRLSWQFYIRTKLPNKISRTTCGSFIRTFVGWNWQKLDLC